MALLDSSGVPKNVLGHRAGAYVDVLVELDGQGAVAVLEVQDVPAGRERRRLQHHGAAGAHPVRERMLQRQPADVEHRLQRQVERFARRRGSHVRGGDRRRQDADSRHDALGVALQHADAADLHFGVYERAGARRVCRCGHEYLRLVDRHAQIESGRRRQHFLDHADERYPVVLALLDGQARGGDGPRRRQPSSAKAGHLGAAQRAPAVLHVDRSDDVDAVARRERGARHTGHLHRFAADLDEEAQCWIVVQHHALEVRRQRRLVRRGGGVHGRAGAQKCDEQRNGVSKRAAQRELPSRNRPERAMVELAGGFELSTLGLRRLQASG
jgi:hypothetical protein